VLAGKAGEPPLTTEAEAETEAKTGTGIGAELEKHRPAVAPPAAQTAEVAP
jgi:hypothetical protein